MCKTRCQNVVILEHLPLYSHSTVQRDVHSICIEDMCVLYCIKVLGIVLHECTYQYLPSWQSYRVYSVRENVYRISISWCVCQNRIRVIVCLEQAINVYLSNQRLLHNVCITYQNVQQYIVHCINLIATCWLFLVLNKNVLLNHIWCIFVCVMGSVGSLIS